MSKVGTYQVMERGDEVHGDGDGHVLKMIKCSTWKRRKKKIKPYEDQGKDIIRDFVLHSRHHRGCE